MKTERVPVWIRKLADRVFDVANWFEACSHQITAAGWWLIRFARWIDNAR